MLNDVSLEIIQKCLNNCIHCSSNSCYTSSAILNLQLIREVVDDIVILGAKRLCLSGGEPFLHTDIVEIIQYAVDKGLILDIYSSGIVGEHNQEQPIEKELLCQCKKAGLNRIIFNLQATRSDIYDSIMQTKHNFKNLLESIKRTQECGIETELHFVPMKQNFKEIDNVIQLAKQLDVCQISFLKLVPHGRAKLNEQKIMLSEEELQYVQEKLYGISEENKKIRIGLPLSYPDSKEDCCHAVKEKLYIKFDGSVFGCEAFKYIKFYDNNKTEITPDNIKEKGIREIYVTSAFLNKSKELVDKYSCKDSGCENCPVQKYLKENNCNVYN